MRWLLLTDNYNSKPMKNIFFFFLFLIVTVKASGQDINWDLKSGLGFYNLHDMKSLQLELLKTTNLTNIKAVEQFPNHQFYSIGVNYPLNPLDQLGIDLSYYTSGGRNHVRDYSGEYKLDMLIKGLRTGVKYLRTSNLSPKLHLGVQMEGGCIFSNLDLQENLQAYDEVIVDEGYVFNSLGLYLEPSLMLSCPLSARNSLFLTGGYEKDFFGKLHLRGEKDQKMGRTADWSGLKISLGINFTFLPERKPTLTDSQDF